MSLRIFIPRDAGAIAVGADEVALALEQAAGKRGIDIEIVQDRLARAVLAGADDRGRNPERARRVRPGHRGRCRFRAGSDDTPTARIRCFWASPTRFPG